MMDENFILNVLSTSIFSEIEAATFLEIVKRCKVKEFKKGQIIFMHGEFGDECGVILTGKVRAEIPNKILNSYSYNYHLSSGDLVGAIAVLSESRRIANVIVITKSVKMLFIPRQTLLELIEICPIVKEKLNKLYRGRILYSSMRNLPLFSSINDTILNELITFTSIHTFQKNELIFSKGDMSDGFYLIRLGVVKIYENTSSEKEKVLVLLKEGQYFGEMALLCKSGKRTANAIACSRCEVIKIPVKDFQLILRSNPNIKRDIENVIDRRKRKNTIVRADSNLQKTLKSVIDAGIVQASSIIMIDTTKCIHCDECEKACAALHENSSRLIRKGFKLNNFLLIPTSCRLCDEPACLIECPTDSIFRDISGEIYHKDTCIGCGTCAKNCPYDNITISKLSKKNNSLIRLVSLLKGCFKIQNNPDRCEMIYKKAVTCDKCKGRQFYACVYNCPTGAVRSVNPAEFFTEITTIG